MLLFAFDSQDLGLQLPLCCSCRVIHCISPRPRIRLLEVHRDKQGNGKKMTGRRAHHMLWRPHG